MEIRNSGSNIKKAYHFFVQNEYLILILFSKKTK